MAEYDHREPWIRQGELSLHALHGIRQGQETFDRGSIPVYESRPRYWCAVHVMQMMSDGRGTQKSVF